MGFAPTWLRQMSPLLRMTTLTTAAIIVFIRSLTLNSVNLIPTSPLYRKLSLRMCGELTFVIREVSSSYRRIYLLFVIYFVIYSVSLKFFLVLFIPLAVDFYIATAYSSRITLMPSL